MKKKIEREREERRLRFSTYEVVTAAKV